ncbi:NUDIX domain-containing protein [Actinokineospora sp. UTMC 2448]|uniref:NUDIX domain-containing protein n=1 Tax=Actinokineospora sp. UTMC 2448 TaxID=2268449 RepID=UPI002164465D|nr:NUDIX domain-containing protein [Actinokineospora sp. UTMC 2448]UVS80742.1 NUDIX domain protein [Actinokineospora sp. UTMC 2448]
MGKGDGDRVVRCERGHLHWGRFGAAGLLPVSDGHVLLQHRAVWTMGGGTWGTFGGARDSHEDAVTAALRETAEESTLDPGLVSPLGILREDHGGWAYDTVIATVERMPPVGPASGETEDAAWVPVGEVHLRPLFGPFAKAWPRVREHLRRPVLVVDCANVMGSRPDGWWRDRRGAATRLRDALAGLGDVPGLGGFDVAFPEVVLVVEGQARGVESVAGVRVVSAEGSGDDTIAELARGGARTVVTADRGLRARCQEAGAEVVGPRWLLDRVAY